MIVLKNVSKEFKIYSKPSDVIKEILFNKSYHMSYKALSDISVEIYPGEIFSIVGMNGAGKSTLLKIISGIIQPDTGEVFIDGKVIPILELGTGFNFDLTGRENIYINGQLLGMEKDYIDSVLDSIIEFSELGDFIDEPLKTYSSGMVVRLAFSIAIHANPNYFIVDEALSVGDAYFQQKSFNRIKELKENGVGIIFVSHDLNAIKVISDRAMLLHKGKIEIISDPETVINHYNILLASVNNKIDISRKGYGNFDVEIKDIKLNKVALLSGDYLEVTIDYYSHVESDDITVGILIRNRFGIDIFGTNTNLLGYNLRVEKGRSYKIMFKVKLDLIPGKYTLTAALHRKDSHISGCYHWIDNAVSFEIKDFSTNKFAGLVNLPTTVSVYQP